MVEEVAQILERLPRSLIDRALENVAAFKTKMTPPDPWDESEFRKRDAEVWELRVQTLGPEAAARRSADDGKRSPVEIY
jgi:beta-N-acetylhexosaminidase